MGMSMSNTATGTDCDRPPKCKDCRQFSRVRPEKGGKAKAGLGMQIDSSSPFNSFLTMQFIFFISEREEKNRKYRAFLF